MLEKELMMVILPNFYLSFRYLYLPNTYIRHFFIYFLDFYASKTIIPALYTKAIKQLN